MSEQLARCPFCGSTHFGVYATFTVNGKKFFAQCSKCGASGPAKKTQAKAKRSWNWRTIDHVLRGELEDARKELAEMKARTCETCLHTRECTDELVHRFLYNRLSGEKAVQEKKQSMRSRISDDARKLLRAVEP